MLIRKLQSWQRGHVPPPCLLEASCLIVIGCNSTEKKKKNELDVKCSTFNFFLVKPLQIVFSLCSVYKATK